MDKSVNINMDENNVLLNYAAFSSFTRPCSMNMKNYIDEFERLYNNMKQSGLQLPDDVLVYHLLNSATVGKTCAASLWKQWVDAEKLYNIKTQVKTIFNTQEGGKEKKLVFLSTFFRSFCREENDSPKENKKKLSTPPARFS